MFYILLLLLEKYEISFMFWDNHNLQRKVGIYINYTKIKVIER